MKKHLLLIAFVAFVVFTADAQRRGRRTAPSINPTFAVGANLLLPVGDASDTFGAGFGVDAKVEIPIFTATYFTGNIGVTRLGYTSDVKRFLRGRNVDRSGETFIPILAGVKHYLNNQFFIEGQIGAAIGTADGAGAAFAFTPGVGFTLPVGNGNAIDLGARYEGWAKDGTLSMFGLRAAYKFKIK